MPGADPVAAGVGDGAVDLPSATGAAASRKRIGMLAGGAVAAVALGALLLKLVGGSSSPGGVGDAGTSTSDAAAAVAAKSDDAKPDGLVLSSTPAALVLLDGVEKGKTPVTLKLSAGNHKLVLLADGYKVLNKEVSGPAKLDLKLDSAHLPEDIQGTSTVKVKCKNDGKLRIFVDDHDSGQQCPTEELNLSVGKHTLTFLDPATGKKDEKKIKTKKGKKPLKVKVKF